MPKGRGHGQPDRQVDEQGEQAIVERPTEREIVRELVDGEQQRVVDHAAEQIAHERDQPPRRVAQEVRRGDLHRDEHGTHLLGSRTRPVELAHLGMGSQDGAPSFGVRLRPVAPAEAVRVGVEVARRPHSRALERDGRGRVKSRLELGRGSSEIR